jgi:hypothetical protein
MPAPRSPAHRKSPQRGNAEAGSKGEEPRSLAQARGALRRREPGPGGEVTPLPECGRRWRQRGKGCGGDRSHARYARQPPHLAVLPGAARDLAVEELDPRLGAAEEQIDRSPRGRRVPGREVDVAK